MNRERRIRLSARDVLSVALLGPRTRIARSALSALGIAIGIAALVAITGAADSQQAQLRQDLDAMGANLLVVAPGLTPTGDPLPLPLTATDMIRRITPVESASQIREIPDSTVFRSDVIPETNTGGLTAALADVDLLTTIDLTLARGRWFDDASRTLPTAVLGSAAAHRLGISEPNARVLVNDRWYAVIGILDSAGLASNLNTTVFVADGWKTDELDAEAISTIYVRTATGAMDSVRAVLRESANPAAPSDVALSKLSDLAEAQEATESALSSLVLGLAGISLLVGGVGIANTMVVAVLERHGEIGLRRALGARTGQVTCQFVLEAVVLAMIGGIGGTIIGTIAVVVLTRWQGIMLRVDPAVLVAGPLIAVAIGALAGLYPALRAARLPPTTALRAG